MQKRIVVIGAGFAGMYAALSAARLRDAYGIGPETLEIAVVAPEPVLDLRPRLYEDDPARMAAPLGELFAVTDVRFLHGTVEAIDTGRASLLLTGAGGERSNLSYDRLVLAAGSRVVRPDIPGLDSFAFSVDQRDEAEKLWTHIQRLAHREPSEERDTVVVAGGGFTGIETAAEMPHRLRSVLGKGAEARVIIVERADAIGPDLGPGPRPVIEMALDALGIERRLGTAVTAVDARGATLSSGERIASATLIWTGGLRATPLAQQIEGPRDPQGRLIVDRELRVPGVPAVFATGDAASAATDDAGNRTLMSCQHAMALGRSAGHNAAADLLGEPARPYRQERYVTCLDLGPWGAVFTEGWERRVVRSGPDVKALKHQVNSTWIYPPKADRAAAFAAAEPGIPVTA